VPPSVRRASLCRPPREDRPGSGMAGDQRPSASVSGQAAAAAQTSQRDAKRESHGRVTSRLQACKQGGSTARVRSEERGEMEMGS
jgi:hypothetical protein